LNLCSWTWTEELGCRYAKLLELSRFHNCKVAFTPSRILIFLGFLAQSQDIHTHPATRVDTLSRRCFL
jgi:hypothetical protein